MMDLISHSKSNAKSMRYLAYLMKSDSNALNHTDLNTHRPGNRQPHAARHEHHIQRQAPIQPGDNHVAGSVQGPLHGIALPHAKLSGVGGMHEHVRLAAAR